MAFSACDEGDFEYSKFHTLSGQEINYKDTLRYEFVPTHDSTYKYFISVRYTDQYEFSNIWLKSIIDGEMARIDIPLFDITGKPLGQCTGGVCTQTIFWKEEASKIGDTIRIELMQNMRKNPLQYISEVGLTIK